MAPRSNRFAPASLPRRRPAELDPSEFLAAAVRADQPRPSRAEAEAAVHTLLSYIGENPDREGLLDTPRRVVEAFDELYQGYHQCPAEVLDRTFGETAGYDDFVLVRDIEFTSQCEHHMMPFYGKAHIAYTPVERVVGLSKLARLTDIFARRLQTQEHLTAQIAAAIDEILKPRGVAVMIEAEHTCMSVRGVAKHGATTFTSRFTGMFRDNPAEQARFLSMVRGRSASCSPSLLKSEGYPVSTSADQRPRRGARLRAQIRRVRPRHLRGDRCRERRGADGRAYERRGAAQDHRERRGLVLQPLAQCVVAER